MKKRPIKETNTRDKHNTKRPTKENYILRKRPTKEISSRQKIPRKILAKQTFEREMHTTKETYIPQKRPIYSKRDLYITKETITRDTHNTK